MAKDNFNYIDVTSEWLDKAQPNSHKVKVLKYWIINNKKHKVDDKKIVLDYSKSEEECAKWLENTFGGEIFLCPRVNIPEGIRTPDFIWNNEYWDLKEIKGNLKNTIDNIIKKAKNQSNNFILEISKIKENDLKIITLVKKIFSSNRRSWVNKIIVKKNNTLIIILTNKN